MAMGRDGSEDWGFCSHLAWFCLTQSPHEGENFLTPSPSLEAPQSLPVPKMRLPKFLSCSYYQACPCPKCMLGGALKMETNCGNDIVENGREKKEKKRPGYHLLYSLLFSQSYYKLTKKILKALYLSQLAHLMWFKILNGRLLLVVILGVKK